MSPAWFLTTGKLPLGHSFREKHHDIAATVYKKDAKSNVSNYRPISLTSQLRKIFEAIVRDAIVNHLEEHSLVNDTQHAFRKGGSCLSNLLQFLDQVTCCIDEDACTDIIYLDFAKAFDKVPHNRLLEKISKHGIDGKVLTWISERLSGRWQQVCVGGQYSSRQWRNFKFRAPLQENHSGPLLQNNTGVSRTFYSWGL